MGNVGLFKSNDANILNCHRQKKKKKKKESGLKRSESSWSSGGCDL